VEGLVSLFDVFNIGELLGMAGRLGTPIISGGLGVMNGGRKAMCGIPNGGIGGRGGGKGGGCTKFEARDVEGTDCLGSFGESVETSSSDLLLLFGL